MVKTLGKENSKKNCFAECLPTALGKENPKKKENKLCRVPDAGTRQSILKK